MNNTEMEIHLLNVQPPLTSYITRFLSRRNVRDYHQDEAAKALRPVRQILDGFGVPYAVHIEVGEKAEAITGTAHRLRCDHIVMSAARKNSLTRLVENSTTNRVLELTSVPVEIIAGNAVSRWERYGIPAGIGTLIALLFAAAVD
jgi:nucleotide-binding universal stress UspA family protein